MNEGLLTQRAEIMAEAGSTGEFSGDKDKVLFYNVPCDLDTIEAGNRLAAAAPGAMASQIAAVVYIVDHRLGRLPNRLFDDTNWLVVDGRVYGISEIHEAINRLTGELDHFELYVYEGRNR